MKRKPIKTEYSKLDIVGYGFCPEIRCGNFLIQSTIPHTSNKTARRAMRRIITRINKHGLEVFQ